MVYEILIPSIPFVGGYLVTYVLYKTGLIKKSLHVNLWNFILFCAFLVTALAGSMIMILLELGVITSLNLGLLYWHVEFGITMALVTLFHIIIYWKSTRRLFTGERARS